MWAFVALTACRVERVVEDPVVECNRTKSVTVVRIAALRDSTVVDLELRNLPGNWVRLSSRTVLRGGTTGEESPLLRADEFPLDEKVTLNRTGLRRVRLVFGAVSRHDSTVDPEPGCRFAARCAYATEECSCRTPELEEVLPKHYVACHHVRAINGLK